MSTQPNSRPDARELGARIAPHLGGPSSWALADDGEHHYARLIRDADGAKLAMTVMCDSQLRIRALWPKYQDGSIYMPKEYLSISCNALRPPVEIAREITRRLLPRYEPTYRAALEDVRWSDAAACEAWLVARRIAHAIGAEPPRIDPLRPQGNCDPVPLRRGPSMVCRLQVHPRSRHSPVTTSFEVEDLNEAMAIRVLKILGDPSPAAESTHRPQADFERQALMNGA